MMVTTNCYVVCALLVGYARAKIHHLSLRDDARRNIVLTNFGFNAGGTFDLLLSNFTVPDQIVSTQSERETRKTDQLGVIGFTMSRGESILQGVRSNPHVCQLQQQDQPNDAIFFVFDFTTDSLKIARAGRINELRICRTLDDCESSDRRKRAFADDDDIDVDKRANSTARGDGESPGQAPIAYVDRVPLSRIDNQYATQLAIRFSERFRGKYHFIFHNCFNYRKHGYSNRVAVDFTVAIVEKNPDSYLSAGDVAKPRMYLYLSTLFAIAGVVWIYYICKSSATVVYRVHKLMIALVIIKSLSLAFHGVNFYFVSVYGHQQEVWAIVFYFTHLLKGSLLFGTIILIGTGYTFFKNFLTDRDRRLFMLILPLQVIDNVAMVIMEESEFGEQNYYFWYQIFILLDLVCCMCIIFPIIWSMRHLQEGAQSDGKAAFNLRKLQLFRQFYMIVIAYIYATRIIKILVEFVVPFDFEWAAEAVVELSTLFFFVLTGYKFRPVEQNPYLKLAQDDDDLDQVITERGIYAGVTRVQRAKARDDADDLQMDDIPGSVSGLHHEDDSDESGNEDELLPRLSRDRASANRARIFR